MGVAAESRKVLILGRRANVRKQESLVYARVRLSTGVVKPMKQITIINPDPEDKLGEIREGGRRFQELREAPFPRADN